MLMYFYCFLDSFIVNFMHFIYFKYIYLLTLLHKQDVTQGQFLSGD